jgi:class 3 adenylate cyclase
MSSPRSLPDDPRLAEVARQLAKTGWACALSDSQWRLVWASDDLQVLLGSPDEEEIGYGRHIFECYLTPTWSNTVTQESQLNTFLEQGPFFLSDTGRDELAAMSRAAAARGDLPQDLTDTLREFFQHLEPAEPPLVHTTKFDYLQGDLPPFPVNLVTVRLRDEQGGLAGTILFYNAALPARVQALVARGDEGMFTRMAQLVEPGRRQAAILFADLQESAVMSRRLPSAAYFKFVRALTKAMDQVVIANEGIVGKHAGDGVSAFFLADDLGSASAAARAAVAAARAMADATGTAAKEVAEETGLFDPAECLVNVGVHWGATLYMGQLVTGGRLEVTALGDEVNECARIQESARDGAALASKVLVEHLNDDDAQTLGLDPDGFVYRTVGELPGASQKALRDAGGIPVTIL